jgi:hypothetical protein
MGTVNALGGNTYNIGGTSVLSSTTLGSGVVNSSLTSVGTLANLTTGTVNVLGGNTYQLGNVTVLTSTTLGSGIVNSSLTSVGTLTGLTVSTGNIVASSVNISGSFVAGNMVNVGSNLYVTGNVSAGGIGYTANGVTYIQGTAGNITSTTSKFGTTSYALTQSQNSYLIIQGITTSSYWSTAFTVEFWYKPTSLFLGCILSSYNGYVYLEQLASGTIKLYIGSSSTGVGGIGSVSSQGKVSAGAWSHIAIMWSGTTWYLGLDAVVTTGTSSSDTGPYTDMALSNGICLGNSYRNTPLYSWKGTPTFCYPVAGYIDEIRFYKSQAYTGSSYTLPTAVFTSDSNTTFLNHVEYSLIYYPGSSATTNSQETPTISSGYGVVADSTGNITSQGTITTVSGNISTTTGSINTLYGSVTSYTSFLTNQNKFAIGPASALQGANVAGNTMCGAFIVSSPGWDLNYSGGSTTHTIFYNTLAMNTNNTNLCGTIKIFVSNKVTSGTGKCAVITADLFRQYGSTTVINTLSTTASTNFTATPTVAASTNDIVVTTDSDCYVSYMFTAAI